MRYLQFILIALLLLNIACRPNNNNDDDDVTPSGNKALVINEGLFGAGNASISVYDMESGVVQNDVFYTKNGRSVGDVAQSAYTFNGKTYIALNVSNKIEIVDAEDISELGVITSVILPRFMEAYNGKLYVSSWGSNGQVYVVDMASSQLIDSIAVGTGPEKMLRNQNKLYVANSGGFSEDSTVSIIDLNTESVVKTLEVGDIPIDLVEDASGHIWVLCKGKTIYDANWQVIGHTESKIVEIDPSTDQVVSALTMFADQHPSHLEISDDGLTVYLGAGYGFSGIYRLNLTGSSIVPAKLVDVDAYGFNLNPENDDLFVLEAPDFVNNGSLKIYTSQGVLRETHEVGVGPNGVLFE